jgi:hypothetical protein
MQTSMAPWAFAREPQSAGYRFTFLKPPRSLWELLLQDLPSALLPETLIHSSL